LTSNEFFPTTFPTMKFTLSCFFSAAVFAASLPLARAAGGANVYYANTGQFSAMFVADTDEAGAAQADTAKERAVNENEALRQQNENLRRQSELLKEQAARIDGPISLVARGSLENVAFIGVETSPVTPALTAQLALPEGTGLVVEQVVPDSPAAASIKPNDILLKLDDQWLIDPWQFAVLVRQHKAGD